MFLGSVGVSERLEEGKKTTCGPPSLRFQGLGVKEGLRGVTYLGVPGSKEKRAEL